MNDVLLTAEHATAGPLYSIMLPPPLFGDFRHSFFDAKMRNAQNKRWLFRVWVQAGPKKPSCCTPAFPRANFCPNYAQYYLVYSPVRTQVSPDPDGVQVLGAGPQLAYGVPPGVHQLVQRRGQSADVVLTTVTIASSTKAFLVKSSLPCLRFGKYLL